MYVVAAQAGLAWRVHGHTLPSSHDHNATQNKKTETRIVRRVSQGQPPPPSTEYHGRDTQGEQDPKRYRFTLHTHTHKTVPLCACTLTQRTNTGDEETASENCVRVVTYIGYTRICSVDGINRDREMKKDITNNSPRRRDGVQPGAVGLARLVAVARRHDAVRLPLPVGHLAAVADDDVARLAGGLGADDALHGHHLPDHRVLCLVGVHGHVRHVKVRVCLEEVQLAAGSTVGHRSAAATEGVAGEAVRKHEQRGFCRLAAERLFCQSSACGREQKNKISVAEGSIVLSPFALETRTRPIV